MSKARVSATALRAAASVSCSVLILCVRAWAGRWAAQDKDRANFEIPDCGRRRYGAGEAESDADDGPRNRRECVRKSRAPVHRLSARAVPGRLHSLRCFLRLASARPRLPPCSAVHASPRLLYFYFNKNSAADLTWATYVLADLPTPPSPRCSSPAQGAKAQQKRERNAEKAPKGAKSQLEVNKAAMTLICQTCRQQFVSAAPLRPCRSPADGRADEHHPAPGVRAPCLRRGCAAHSVRRLEQHTQDKHSKSVADCFPVRPLTSPACPSLAS
jgi:hypothetical protein